MRALRDGSADEQGDALTQLAQDTAERLHAHNQLPNVTVPQRAPPAAQTAAARGKVFAPEPP